MTLKTGMSGHSILQMSAFAIHLRTGLNLVLFLTATSATKTGMEPLNGVLYSDE